MADPGKKRQWWEHKTPHQKKCVHCGEAFLTRIHNRKSCSPACNHQYRLAYRRQYRADHPIPKKGRRRVPSVLGHAGSEKRQGLKVKIDLGIGELPEWFHATCQKHDCSMSELARAAVKYSLTGKVTIAPRPAVKRARLLQVTVNISDAIALRDDYEKNNSRSQPAYMRRLLWQLKACLDPPVGG